MDLHSDPRISLTENKDNECNQDAKLLFPGNDYCNEKQKPMANCDDYTYCTLDRGSEVRMPFHDTAVCIEGDVAQDFSHHFVQLWNNAKLDK